MATEQSQINAVAFAAKTPAVNFAATGTPGLNLFLIQKRASLPPEAYVSLMAEVNEEFTAHKEALEAASAGVERARVFHQRMDEAMKFDPGLRVSCQKGCGGCCHHEVEVTADEAELLAGLVQNGFEIDRTRLAAQARRPPKSPAWAVPLNVESRCVFLDAEGSCRIYEDRPAACRKHAVVSPPQACITIGATTRPIQAPRAEVLISAALALKGSSFLSLAKSLALRLRVQASHAAGR